MKPTSGIYALEPEALELLSKDTFTESFSTNDFIESLAAQNNVIQESSSTFDPKPYIRTFEAALNHLEGLKLSITENNTNLRRGTSARQNEHMRRIGNLKQSLSDVVDEFTALQLNIQDVGEDVVKIGRDLEAIEHRRRSAEDANLLFGCYLEFFGTGKLRVEQWRSDVTQESKMKCAVVSRRLLSLSKELTGTEFQEVRVAIERHAEEFEKELLRAFDKAYRRGDIREMAASATILHTFNGGASVVQVFVNQHDFFIEKARLHDQRDFTKESFWAELSDPDKFSDQLESLIMETFQEFPRTVQQESLIIEEIFPDPMNVIDIFMQRIFAQSIQSRLEYLMRSAESSSLLCYLRCLQVAHRCVVKLVDELKAITHRPLTDDRPQGSLASVLDHHLEDLFVPYLEELRYSEREQENLQELYASLLFRFSALHSQKNVTMFEGMKRRLQNAATSSSTRESASNSENKTSSALLKIARLDRRSSADRKLRKESRELKTNSADSKILELTLSKDDGLVDFTTVRRMLGWHVETVSRVVELCSQNDIAAYLQTLVTVLLDFMIKGYIDTVLDAMLSETDFGDPFDPSFEGFSNLHAITLSLNLLQTYIKSTILVLMGDSIGARREVATSFENAIDNVEKKIERVIRMISEKTLAAVATHLRRQKSHDFSPFEDDQTFSYPQTDTCRNIVSLLQRVRRDVGQFLDAQNLNYLFAEIGLGFFSHLLGQLKRSTINAAGGLVLSKDVTEYESLIGSWEIASLKQPFALLHELVNIYIVQPSVLRSVVREGLLANVKLSTLQPFVTRRADFYTNNVYYIFATDQYSGTYRAGT